MVPVLTGKERPVTKGVPYRGPPDLVAEIDQAAHELGISRNEAMTQLLRFALDAHRRDARKAKK
jgi:Ribbon-helix-helix protein, copG family